MDQNLAPWTEEILFLNGDSFFKDLSQAIFTAKISIHLETYIFDQDQLGNRILQLLAETAARGVQVRLLLDGVGSSQWRHEDAQEWRRRGIDLKFYHPLPWQRSPERIWKSINLQKIILGFKKLNHRNHRKICIIDEKTAWLGSMNISDRHLTSVHGTHAWRDTAVRLQGPGIPLLIKICNHTWSNARNHFQPGIWRQKRAYYHRLLKKIAQAKTRVWITTPYLIPSIPLILMLRKVASSGVDVRMVLQDQSDFFGVKYAMEGFYSTLLNARVRIYEYTPCILHAKVLIIDQWVTVGSSNLDHRSLFHDLETDAVISRPENIHTLETQFLQDVSVSREIDPLLWKKRAWIDRLLQWFFLLFKEVL